MDQNVDITQEPLERHFWKLLFILVLDQGPNIEILGGIRISFRSNTKTPGQLYLFYLSVFCNFSKR